MSDFSVVTADWSNVADRARCAEIRETVFIQEQSVPVEEEWDDDDATSVHALALDLDGTPIGTGRLLPDGHLGRIAVLKQWRGLGVGAAIMNALIAHANDAQLSGLVLNAQTHAIPFYESLGFRVDGDEFMDAGIPHVAMYLSTS